MSLYPWYSGTVHPETIIGGTTAGEVAASERTNALMNLGPIGGVIPVGPLAAGTASGKDKAKIAAAYAMALAQPGGATIILWPGRYNAGDLASLILPPYTGAGSPIIHFQGSGHLGTEILFDVDQGAGKYAVSLGGTEFDLYFHTFENVRFIGPGDPTGVAKGSPPVNTIGGGPTLMSGIQHGSRMKLLRGGCYGFRSGVEVKGNHNEMRSWDSNGNYDGVRFANDPADAGDVLIDNCDLTGNQRSSIAVSSTAVASFGMVKGHTGFGPYCVYFEAGRTGGSGLALGGAFFHQTSFEAAGNSFFYDPDHMARCQGVTLLQTGNYSRDHATYGIAAVTNNPGVYVRDWADVHFIDGFPLGVLDGALFDVTNVLSMETNVWKASYDASVAAGKSWILFGGVGSTPEVYLRERSNWRAVAAQNDTAANITAGMVLELGGAINGFRPWRFYGGVNTGPLAGVALNAVGTSARDLVVCVKESFSVPVLVDSAPASAYQIMASSVTAGKATGVVYDGIAATGGRPLIGSAVSGPVPTIGGSVNCRVAVP